MELLSRLLKRVPSEDPTSCVDLVHAALTTEVCTPLPSSHILVMLGQEQLNYNRRLVRKSVNVACPRGFSFHLALCDLQGDYPHLVFDPSFRVQVQVIPFLTYCGMLFSKPGAPEQYLSYYTMPAGRLAAMQPNEVAEFDPYGMMEEYAEQVRVVEV